MIEHVYIQQISSYISTLERALGQLQADLALSQKEKSEDSKEIEAKIDVYKKNLRHISDVFYDIIPKEIEYALILQKYMSSPNRAVA